MRFIPHTSHTHTHFCWKVFCSATDIHMWLQFSPGEEFVLQSKCFSICHLLMTHQWKPPIIFPKARNSRAIAVLVLPFKIKSKWCLHESKWGVKNGTLQNYMAFMLLPSKEHNLLPRCCFMHLCIQRIGLLLKVLTLYYLGFALKCTKLRLLLCNTLISLSCHVHSSVPLR